MLAFRKRAFLPIRSSGVRNYRAIVAKGVLNRYNRRQRMMSKEGPLVWVDCEVKRASDLTLDQMFLTTVCSLFLEEATDTFIHLEKKKKWDAQFSASPLRDLDPIRTLKV